VTGDDRSLMRIAVGLRGDGPPPSRDWSESVRSSASVQAPLWHAGALVDFSRCLSLSEASVSRLLRFPASGEHKITPVCTLLVRENPALL
jgi:hypothetical protein